MTLRWCMALLSTIVSASAAAGQTQDVQGSWPEMTAERIQESLRILRAPVDTRRFASGSSFRDVLEQLYEQMEAGGYEIAFLVDSESCGHVLDATVKTADLPDRMSVSDFLREVVLRVAGKDGAILVHPGFFEVTTREIARRAEYRASSSWRLLGLLRPQNAPRAISLDDLERKPWELMSLATIAFVGVVAAAVVWNRRRLRFNRLAMRSS